jgi:hypothetical protein
LREPWPTISKEKSRPSTVASNSIYISQRRAGVSLLFQTSEYGIRIYSSYSNTAVLSSQRLEWRLHLETMKGHETSNPAEPAFFVVSSNMREVRFDDNVVNHFPDLLFLAATISNFDASSLEI